MAIDLHDLPPWALPVAGGALLGLGWLALHNRGGGQAAAITPLPVTGQGGGTTIQQPDLGGLLTSFGDTLTGVLHDQADAQAKQSADTQALLHEIGQQQLQGQQANATLLGGLSTSIASWFAKLGDQQAAQAIGNQQLIHDLQESQSSLFDKILAGLGQPPVAPVAPAPGPGGPGGSIPDGSGVVTPPSNTLPVPIPTALTHPASWWADVAQRVGGQGWFFGPQTGGRVEAGTDSGYGFVLPVAYNSAHDALHADFSGHAGVESAAVRLIRFVADAMQGNPNGDVQQVARQQLVRIGADILDAANQPVDISQAQAGQYLWVGGYDFGPVYSEIVAERRRRHG